MKIENIVLNNFRNFEEQKITLDDHLNIFFGKNGQGKTNIIESIYFLLKGFSFRENTIDSYVRCNSHQQVASVLIDMKKNDLRNHISVHFLEKRKEFYKNKKKISHFKLAREFSCILFHPDSLFAIKGAPHQRRELIDELLVIQDPHYNKILAEFKKCLSTRNKILKDYVKKKNSHFQFLKMLESINPIYVNLSEKITFARMRSIREFEEFLNINLQEIENNKGTKISFEYLISKKKVDGSERENTIYALQQEMSNYSKLESIVGMTLFGPQRHDIRFLYNGRDSRYFCSQGQQRTIILSFKMAQIMYHYKVHQYYPVLLLDDVMSELDVERRKALLNFLSQIKVQTLMTATDTTHHKDINSSKYKTFHIENGKVESTLNIRS